MMITKTFKWAMAHRLEGHKGLCKNCHGHNYKLIVNVESLDGKGIDKEKTNEGMVCDFTDLKIMVNDLIVEKFDHAFVYNEKDEYSVEIAEFLVKKIDQKILALPFRTTAENMAKWIVDRLEKYFMLNEIRLKCISVELYETDGSSAIHVNK